MDLFANIYILAIYQIIILIKSKDGTIMSYSYFIGKVKKLPSNTILYTSKRNL